MRLAIAILLLCSACGGGGGLPTGASPVMADVEFYYQATEGQRSENYGCNGLARIYPSWWGFTHAMMIATDEGRWAALFENVPVGPQSVRIEPPMGCENPNLVVNDTVLSAADDKMVFSFTVHHDGSVSD